MRKGFTLIELMIVVAIIAVIAAIAIPNLVASKIASNETAAVACMRTYLSAQNQFHRSDFYDVGALVYANVTDGLGFLDLYAIGGPGGTPVLKLIDLAFANATVGSTTPRAGFVFDDVEYPAGDQSIDCGLSAAPLTFGRSGRNVYVIDVTGVVYQQIGAAACVPVTAYPADADLAADWIPVGLE